MFLRSLLREPGNPERVDGSRKKPLDARHEILGIRERRAWRRQLLRYDTNIILRGGIQAQRPISLAAIYSTSTGAMGARLLAA